MTEYDNSEILRIALSQYFCNLEEESKGDYIKYFEMFKQSIDEDEDLWWDDLENYIIWEPFETSNPSSILENILSLYDDILKLQLKEKLK